MKTNSLDFDAQALREKILDLAMRGKLVKQDPNDEPASILLEKIKVEKAKLVKEGKIKKSKPLPEITDDEKPFDIPDSWEWVRLGDVYDFIDYRGKTPHKISSGIRLITAKNVRNGYIKLEPEEFISKQEYIERSTRGFINKEDIFITTEAPMGLVAINRFNEPIATAQRLITLRKYVQQQNNDFIAFQMQSSFFQERLKSKSTGSTVKGIKAANLKQVLILIPPLSEQSRIAAKIAQLFALLRKVESSTQQYAKLQTLLKSKVLDLAMRGKLVKQDPNDEPASVLLEKEGLKESNEIPHQIPNSWSWIVLGSGAKFINGRAYKKSELLNDSSLTPILRVGNLFTNSSYYYSDLKLNPDKYIDNGDLIYAWSASFGPQIWTGGHVIYHYHIWKVIPKQIIEKQFLYYFLLDKRNVIGETDLHGSTMKHITKTNMEHLSFPLPPLSEQKRIVKKINFLLEIL